MFEWLRFIGEFIFGIVESIPHLLTMLVDSASIFHSSILLAPEFLSPVLLLIMAVAIVMWVVNIF